MSKRSRLAEEKTERAANEANDETVYVTRTARTLAARAVNKVGMLLPDFPQEALDRLELPEELREAVDVCQKLKLRGKSRQKRLICQLLRDEDHEPIIKRILAMEAEIKLSRK